MYSPCYLPEISMLNSYLLDMHALLGLRRLIVV
jgi:hypothetical protein